MKFVDKVPSVKHEPLTSAQPKILQVNVGYRCNMACTHCHVSAGPGRTEVMDGRTAEKILQVFLANPFDVMDLTGGAPEMNPHFRMLVTEARRSGRRVVVRTNLTILFEPGMEYLPSFFRTEGVELIASLPCYLKNNVSMVRGQGAYQKSMDALRLLNEQGYGREAAGLVLNLVYNPGGAFLPPSQAGLEADYKRELRNRYGILFTHLFAFANMPIGRFREALSRSNSLEGYLAMLEAAFNPNTLENIMCRHLVNVGWDGALYDCDFNQALGIPLTGNVPRSIADFDYPSLARRTIAAGDHCYACTAGQGSS